MNVHEANNKSHPVEDQWHFPILVKHGFAPDTKEQTGLVRRYTYSHPDGRKIVCVTGMNSDYWNDTSPNLGGRFKGGYWRDLEKHLSS